MTLINPTIANNRIFRFPIKQQLLRVDYEEKEKKKIKKNQIDKLNKI